MEKGEIEPPVYIAGNPGVAILLPTQVQLADGTIQSITEWSDTLDPQQLCLGGNCNLLQTYCNGSGNSG